MSLAVIEAGLSTVAEIVANIDKIKEFAADAVTLVETVPNATGAAKLAAVQSAVKAFIAALTTLANVAVDAYNTIKDQITAFVNGIVALWRSIGVFSTSTPAAATPAAV